MIQTANQPFLITVANFTMLPIDNAHACHMSANILVPRSQDDLKLNTSVKQALEKIAISKLNNTKIK